MTPAARVQAAIELLDAIIAAARDGGRGGRHADRALFRDAPLCRIEGPARGARAGLSRDPPAAASGRRAAARRWSALARRRCRACRAVRRLGAWPGADRARTSRRAAAASRRAWLVDRARRIGLDAAEQAALLERAPLDLRVNRAEGDAGRAARHCPRREPIAGTARRPAPAGRHRCRAADAWRDGLIEVQDAGSQIDRAGRAARRRA